MSRTLEQLILALPCDGATTLAIIGALKEAGLADATVYGICPTCGGSRKCPACGGRGKVEVGFHTQEAQYVDVTEQCEDCNGTGACPDCTAVSVVTKELRERAAADLHDAIGIERDEVGHIDRVTFDADAALDAVLSTVLGKTLVAKDVLEGAIAVHNSLPPQPPMVYVGGKLRDEGQLGMAGETVAIAILEDDDE